MAQVGVRKNQNLPAILASELIGGGDPLLRLSNVQTGAETPGGGAYADVLANAVANGNMTFEQAQRLSHLSTPQFATKAFLGAMGWPGGELGAGLGGRTNPALDAFFRQQFQNDFGGSP